MSIDLDQAYMEINELRDEVAALRAKLDAVTRQRDEAFKALVAAADRPLLLASQDDARDADRLDWMIRTGCRVGKAGRLDDLYVVVEFADKVDPRETPRAAIDAAILAAAQEGKK